MLQSRPVVDELVARGRELAPPGYFDATEIFRGENRTVYADNCCHFNKLGSEMLADFIVRKIGPR